MNHEQFAAECPTLDFKRARRLCEAHGADLGEYVDDLTAGTGVRVTTTLAAQERYNTLDLCRWLGY